MKETCFLAWTFFKLFLTWFNRMNNDHKHIFSLYIIPGKEIYYKINYQFYEPVQGTNVLRLFSVNFLRRNSPPGSEEWRRIINAKVNSKSQGVEILKVKYSTVAVINGTTLEGWRVARECNPAKSCRISSHQRDLPPPKSKFQEPGRFIRF